MELQLSEAKEVSKEQKKRSYSKRGLERIQRARAFNISALEEDISNPLEEFESKFESE